MNCMLTRVVQSPNPSSGVTLCLRIVRVTERASSPVVMERASSPVAMVQGSSLGVARCRPGQAAPTPGTDVTPDVSRDTPAG